MKVVSTKYKVAISNFTIFMVENVYMQQIVFTTTIDTMLFLSVFSEILTSYGPSIRSWTPETRTPTDPTGSPEHRKNHFDEVQAGSGAVTHQGDMCLNVLLYCIVWLMMYSNRQCIGKPIEAA